MNGIWRLLIAVASMLLDPESRARHREQWLADVEGAAEVGIAPRSVVLGALRTAPTMTPSRGALMPVGPLAIALKHTSASQRKVATIAVLAVALLVLGVGLLLLR